MKFSDSMSSIAKALLSVQQEIEPIVKDSTNPHFKNNYASHEKMNEYAKPILNRHGVVLIQGADDALGPHGGIMVSTMLLHTSGEWVKSSIEMPLQKNDPQGAGSAITYGRRYGLSAILALTTEEDDDAEGATRHTRQMQSVAAATGHRAPPPAAPPAPARTSTSVPTPRSTATTASALTPPCPICHSDMWDNRPKKASGQFKATSPDARCKDKACNGVVWKIEAAAEKPAATQHGGPGLEEVPVFDEDGNPLF